MLKYNIGDLEVWESKGKIYAGIGAESKDITDKVMNHAGLVVMTSKGKKYVFPWGNGTLKWIKGA